MSKSCPPMPIKHAKGGNVGEYVIIDERFNVVSKHKNKAQANKHSNKIANDEYVVMSKKDFDEGKFAKGGGIDAEKANIEAEIADYEKIVKNEKLPKDERDFAADEIKDLKEKLSKLKEKPAPAPKPAPKKKEEPKKEEKKPAAPKKTAKKDDEEAEPDCEELEKRFKKRREASKKSAKKSKTTPVFRKITSDVVAAVTKAVKSVSAEDIKADPKAEIGKMEKLASAAESFLKTFKDVLGSDYKASEGDKEFADLEKLLENLTKKYAKK